MNDDRLRRRSWTLARLCASAVLGGLDRLRGDEGLVGLGRRSRVGSRQEAGGGRCGRTGRTPEARLGDLRVEIQVGGLRVVGVLLDERRDGREGLVRCRKRVGGRGDGTTGARGRVGVRMRAGAVFDSDSRGRVPSSASSTVRRFWCQKRNLGGKEVDGRTLVASSTPRTQRRQ